MKPLISIAALATLAATPAGAATLTFQLADVRASRAPLYLSVQRRDQFMEDGGAYGAVLAETSAGPMTIRIENVAPGEYAPTVWHDDNANGRFDMGEDYVPLDGWTMVGARRRTGEPSFDAAKIVVGAEDMTIPLEMIYGR